MASSISSLAGPYTHYFTLLGATLSGYLALRLLSSLASYAGSCCRRRPWKKGDWALVTGSTDGIGKAYARHLANAGLNLVLVARNQDKLNDVKKEIAEEFRDIEVVLIRADFSRPDVYNTPIKSQLKDSTKKPITVSLLINNVGVSYSHPMYFTELDEKTRTEMVHTNLTSVVEMTALVLPDMVEAKRGAIINIASAASRTPGSPLLALYSSTKAAVEYFSSSLHHEVRGKGVIVECHSPYFVKTKMSKIRNASFFTPEPEDYVASSLGSFGSAISVVPFWTHALQDSFMKCLPDWAQSALVMWMHKDIRNRAIKKAAREVAAAKKA